MDPQYSSSGIATADSTQERRRPGCCVAAIGLLLLPYLLNFMFVMGRSMYNRVKWNRNGSSSYAIEVSNSSFDVIAGDSVIFVEDGEIVAIDHNMCEPCNQDDFRFWERLTIEGMFDSSWRCVVLFPIISCSIDYEKDYGFPSDILMNCPLPDACYDRTVVGELRLKE